MKKPLSIFALVLTAACGGSGGSIANQPSAINSSSTTLSSPVAGTPAAPSPTQPTITTPAPTNSFASALNNVRARNGAGSVSYDSRLGRAAQGHANDMLANNFFSHTGSNGSTVGQRVTAQGYQWNAVGENIARGQPDEAAVLQAWVNSPGHQRNNVNPNFEDFALAKAGSGSRQYWVLVLARER